MYVPDRRLGQTVKIPTGRQVVDRHGHLFAEYEFFEYVEPGGGLGDLGKKRKKGGGFFRSIGKFFESTGKAIGRVIVPVATTALSIVAGGAASLVPGGGVRPSAAEPAEYFQPPPQPVVASAPLAPAGAGPFGLPGWFLPTALLGALGLGALAVVMRR